MLIFMHIPKTAGTTLRSVLERQYGQEGLLPIYATETKAALADMGNHQSDRLRQAKVLSSLDVFGLHEQFSPEAKYFTMLRDPLERLLSTYYYLRAETNNPYHEMASQMSLPEFVRDPHLQSDNHQLRYIVGNTATFMTGDCAPKHLELAKKNLREHFVLTGLAERFDESLILMRRRFGWRRLPLYHKLNVHESRPTRKSISASVQDELETHLEYDRALYAHAEQLLDEAIAAEGAAFEDELAMFQLALADVGDIITQNSGLVSYGAHVSPVRQAARAIARRLREPIAFSPRVDTMAVRPRHHAQT